MKVEYCVAPTVDVFIDDKSEVPEKLCFDDADVYFEITGDKLLKNIKVVYTGLPIQLIERGGADGKRIFINPSYPEVNNKALKVISYCLNYIQAETEMPVLEVTRLTNIEPTISPETQEEEEKWKNHQKRVDILKVFRSKTGCIGEVNLNNLKKHSEHAKAYANFADAQSDQNPITKYDSLYKVVEYFLGDNAGIDQRAYDFMIQYDSTFTLNNFQELRVFRNRCTHPHQRLGHITSSDIDLMEELFAKTEQLQRIAELLLKQK